MTDEVQFEPPSNITTVLSVSPLPFDHFPLGQDATCADPQNERRFSIKMRDLDVEAPLLGYWFVNGDPPRGTDRGISQSPATAELSLEREGTLCLPKESFDLPCNLVEVLVTDDVLDQRRIDPYLPRTKWFILAPSDLRPDVRPSDCVALFDAGTNAGVDGGADGGAEGGVP